VATTILGTSSGPKAAQLQELWPLRLGNQVALASAGEENAPMIETFPIVRHELVTVLAGSFDTFVIEREIASNDRAYSFHDVVSYWYAPEVGYAVKTAHNLKNGGKGRRQLRWKALARSRALLDTAAGYTDLIPRYGSG
jgi:hypothetical protein